MQAAVRGHLVRRQAIETFRCIQAIIRMQALVRAHHARQLVEKSSPEDKNFQVDKSEILKFFLVFHLMVSYCKGTIIPALSSTCY